MIRMPDKSQKYFGRYESESEAYDVAFQTYLDIYGEAPWERN